jgi:hypothetical protein
MEWPEVIPVAMDIGGWEETCVRLRAENYGQDAAGSPGLCFLLQLQDYVSATLVVLE